MIREMNEKDYESVQKLIQQGHELHYKNRPDIYNDIYPFPHSYFKALLAEEDSLNYVYEENTKIIGLMIVSKKEVKKMPILSKRNFFYINDIVVDKDYRGKGIGKKLFKFIENLAKENGQDSVELNVWSFNEYAINFYKSLGLNVKTMILEKKLK